MSDLHSAPDISDEVESPEAIGYKPADPDTTAKIKEYLDGQKELAAEAELEPVDGTRVPTSKNQISHRHIQRISTGRARDPKGQSQFVPGGGSVTPEKAGWQMDAEQLKTNKRGVQRAKADNST